MSKEVGKIRGIRYENAWGECYNLEGGDKLGYPDDVEKIFLYAWEIQDKEIKRLEEIIFKIQEGQLELFSKEESK